MLSTRKTSTIRQLLVTEEMNFRTWPREAVATSEWIYRPELWTDDEWDRRARMAWRRVVEPYRRKNLWMVLCQSCLDTFRQDRQAESAPTTDSYPPYVCRSCIHAKVYPLGNLSSPPNEQYWLTVSHLWDHDVVAAWRTRTESV